MLRLSLLPLPLLILFVSQPANVAGQTNDLLKRQEALEEITRQKVSAQVKEAFEMADRMAATSKIRGIEHLRRLQISLENEPALSGSLRTEFENKIADRIKLLENRTSASKDDPKSNAVNPKELATAKAKAWVEEYQEMKRGLEVVSALQKSGNSELAKKEAEALAKRYPNNPSAIILNESTGMSQKLADAKVLQAQQSEGFMLAMRSIDKASIPPKDDIEFDTVRKGYFKEITKARMKSPLSATEEALLKALGKPISVDYKGLPFETAIEKISELIGKPILLEKQSLTDAQIDSNTLVNVPNLNNVAARTVLRKVLQDNGLTFMIRNETIQVVTLEKARQSLITRVYYIGDIVSGTGPFGNEFNFGPQINLLQMTESANMIINSIEKIDALSWKREGGAGTATFHAPSMSIIVRQTAEVQSMLGTAFLGK